MLSRGCKAQERYRTAPQRPGKAVAQRPEALKSLSQVKFDRILNATPNVLPALGANFNVQSVESCTAAALAKIIAKSSSVCIIVAEPFCFNGESDVPKVMVKLMKSSRLSRGHSRAAVGPSCGSQGQVVPPRSAPWFPKACFGDAQVCHEAQALSAAVARNHAAAWVKVGPV